MIDEKTRKGLIFGILATLFVGFQPIITVSRPSIFNPFLFAAMTCAVEAIIFFPLMLIERKMIKTNYVKGEISNEEKISYLHGWKNKKKIILYIGATFGFGQFLFTVGYDLSGSINGAIAQKSTVIFSLLFGYIIMKEKIKLPQIIFSLVLLFGLVLVVTEGSFNILEFNLGVLLILLLSFLWMMAHTITKKYILNLNYSTPSQLVFIRNSMSAIILLLVSSIFSPLDIVQIFNPINAFYYISLGVVYSIGLFFWYSTLSNLKTSIATILVSPTPILTALLSVLILGDTLTIYHILGSIIVISSIIMIVRPSSKNKEK